ncbi:MAG: hypothetical protein ACP5MZ_02595 [Candidatus Micrarchaeia archaeon]
MHMKRKVAFAVAVLSVLAIAAAAFSFAHFSRPGCPALCLYHTEIGNGKVSIWLAWKGMRLSDSDVRVLINGKVMSAATNSSGVLTVLVGPGFGGGKITVYYEGYYVADSIYAYPYVQDLIYIVIGLLIYAFIKKLSDISISRRKVHLLFREGGNRASEYCPVGIADLSEAITEAASESSEAIRYKGVVADVQSVCLKIARRRQIGGEKNLPASDEIDSLLHFEGERLGLRAINGTIYGSADALTDLSARYIYNEALFNNSYLLPKGITSSSMVKHNNIEIANISGFSIIAHRVLHRKQTPKILVIGIHAKTNMLSKACLPSRRASAFMLAYLSGAAGVSYA